MDDLYDRLVPKDPNQLTLDQQHGADLTPWDRLVAAGATHALAHREWIASVSTSSSYVMSVGGVEYGTWSEYKRALDRERAADYLNQFDQWEAQLASTCPDQMAGIGMWSE